MGLRESLNEKVSKYMSSDFAKVDSEETVVRAALSMKDSKSTEAIVTKDAKPVGIVTERDILYKVVAPGLNPVHVKVKDVMNAPVETVDESAKVSDAISRMSARGIRRLGVTKDGKLVGLVTQKAMVSGPLEQHVPLPELAAPGKIACPYCDATMKDPSELSRHIDQVHLGLGLLQGDKSKW